MDDASRWSRWSQQLVPPQKNPPGAQILQPATGGGQGNRHDFHLELTAGLFKVMLAGGGGGGDGGDAAAR